MKELSLVLSLCLLFALGATTNVQASNDIQKVVVLAKKKTVKFKVYGNCGMCKNTIENALKGVKGISWSTWNTETKMITVRYNPKKIKLEDIHKKIAAVGYDTEKAKAKDEVYNNLHGCCQYDRPTKK
ncbi:MAG: heavy-metal-associated domain-containing protein [Saprospiraceae bacterium]